MAKKILVVDDDPVQRRLLEAALVKAGYLVDKLDSGEEAIISLKQDQQGYSAVILDLVMPGMDGMAVLQVLKDADIDTPIIVQTAQGGIETVVRAMRLGAFDFVVKPIAPDRLLKAVDNASKFEKLTKSSEKKYPRSSTAFTFKNIVTKSECMKPIITMGEKAAVSTIPVLIEGESGVGKELIARAIHGASVRANRPMVTVNCGALPENLVESLLFGHEKGAFTGASEKHVGKFEEADGSTLFLDEIGELPLDLQVKLLRAIQEGIIDPVGGKKSLKVDVRLVSATNRDLLKEVKAGRFREDLYYRLNVLPMTIPPLRERKNDIEPLVYHFVKKIAREEGKNYISAVNPATLAALGAYEWPGNIRELENAVFRAIVLCDREELGMEDFPQIISQLPDFELPEMVEEMTLAVTTAPAMTTPVLDDDEVQKPNSTHPSALTRGNINAGTSETTSLSRPTMISSTLPATGSFGLIKLVSNEGQIKTLSEIESEAIQFAMEIYNNRMSEIARRLDIGRSTLYRKLKEHGIEEISDSDSQNA